MNFDNILYPKGKYACPSCGSDNIGFVVDRLDFSLQILVNSGNAKLVSLSDPLNYKELDLWQCKNCFDVGEFTKADHTTDKNAKHLRRKNTKE